MKRADFASQSGGPSNTKGPVSTKSTEDIVSSIDYSKTDNPSKCTGIYDLLISDNYDVCFNQMMDTQPDEIACIFQKKMKKK